MGNIVKKEGELDKMLTPWDSDSIIMMDIDCFERGCACTASDWAAGHRPECVPVVQYKPWVGLTNEDIVSAYEVYAKYQEEGMEISGWVDFYRAIEAKLKEKNT